MRSAKEWLAHCEALSGGATERSVSAHVLRHSRATDLIERTGKVKGVARILGHASEATRLRYYVRQSLTDEELSEGV